MTTPDIKILYEASIPEYSKLFAILLTNGKSFPRFTQGSREVLGLIHLTGNPDQAQRAIGLARNKIEDKLRKAADTALNSTSIEQQSAGIAEIRKLIPGGTSFAELILSAIKQDAVVIPETEYSDGLSAFILDAILDKYAREPKSIRDNEMIAMMKELHLASPRFQASICAACLNFELIFSSSPNREPTCSRCNKENITVRVYLLEEEFNTHKARNKDLPLYIQYYLEKKHGLKANVFKRIDGKGEIDVWVEETSTGIECKLELNAFAQESQIDSLAGELRDQLKTYVEGGARRLLVVTNLVKSDALALQKLVAELLAKEEVGYEYLKVLDNSITQLWQALDSEAKMIM